MKVRVIKTGRILDLPEFSDERARCNSRCCGLLCALDADHPGPHVAYTVTPRGHKPYAYWNSWIDGVTRVTAINAPRRSKP